uniref:Ribosyl nicotinamide transporter, PnuC-like n=1 Tax=uncultured Armatimonadetes bacterium TaxID=157466 RepID=A0A6J4IUS6_9BACT|nr:hypothetical protein AVDCRST_MAG63-3217 [uncultured Armatimonadetes bacterium]
MESLFSSGVLRFLSVERIAFTVLGYPLSYVELIGTVFNLWSVWLATKNRVATWPVGFVGVLLFLALFYQVRLYSDVVEQIYYLFACAYGWWQWGRASGPNPKKSLPIRFSTVRTLLIAGLVTIVLSLAAGAFTSRMHLLYPALFPEAASYPYLDAATTVGSFTATFLMALRRLECWIYWLVIDTVGVGLYFTKDVRFVALLYVIFLVLAASGLRLWMREARKEAGRGPVEAPAAT